MNLFTQSTKSKIMEDYLHNNKKIYNDEEYYYFWIIDIEDGQDINKVLSFFDELFNDAIFLEYDKRYIMFYFTEIEFEVENIIGSLIDDLSFKIKIYTSSKMDSSIPKNFSIIYDLYKKYLLHKSNFYMTNVELVSEIIKNDINEIRSIKPIVLNRLLEDSQMEGLIMAMFLNNLNVTKTASAVYMHRNTVINKLETIKRESGFNLQRFLDANIMYWLLKIK